MLIAAVDRILSQFGGSARSSVSSVKVSKDQAVSSKKAYGNGRTGPGDGRYDRAGTGTAHILGPVIIPVYEMLGANPSCSPERCWRAIWAASSSPKSCGRRRSSVAILRVNSRVDDGPTIVFSIPVALGIIEPSDRRIWRSACWRAL